MSTPTANEKALQRHCRSCGAKPGDLCIDKRKHARGKNIPTANPHNQRFEDS